VPITTKVVSLNPVQDEVYLIQHYVIQFVSDFRQVGGFLYTTLCDTVCQWLSPGRWFSLYNIMWYSLSVTCSRSVVFSIQHYVIQFVSDLQQVGGFLYTTLCDTVCQWLAAGRWFSPCISVSSTNKTDRHDIQVTVPLNTITLNNKYEIVRKLRDHSSPLLKI
jgi:hypothetical protein